MRRGCLVGLALAATGCTAFDSLSDCSSDADCSLGYRCHPIGDFCELDQGPIEIGVVRGETVAEQVDVWLEFAAGFVHDNGGVLGRDIEFVQIPDLPEQALRDGLDDFIDRRVHAVIGGFSRSILTVSEVTYPEQVLTITAQATTPALREAQPNDDRYIFRTVAPVDLGEASAMARYLVEPDVGCGSLTLAYSEVSAFYIGYRDAVTELLPKAGGCIATEIRLPATAQPSYPDLIDALDGLGADGPGCVLILDDSSTALRTIVAELGVARAERGWLELQLFGGSNYLASDFLDVAGEAAVGAVFSDGYLDPTRAATREFLELYEQRAGGQPATDELFLGGGLFDVTMLIAHATTRVGSTTDRVGLRDSLWEIVTVSDEHTTFGPGTFRQATLHLQSGQEIHYNGAVGDLELNEFGEPSLPAQIFQVAEDGPQSVAIYTAAQATELAALPSPPEGTCAATQTIDLR